MVEHSTRGLKLVSTEQSPTPMPSPGGAGPRLRPVARARPRGAAVLLRRASRPHALGSRPTHRPHPRDGATSAPHVRAPRLHAQRRASASSSRHSSSTSGTRTSRRASSPTSCSPTWRRCRSGCNESVSASVLDGDEIVYIAACADEADHDDRAVARLAAARGDHFDGPRAARRSARRRAARAARRDAGREARPSTPRPIRRGSSG